MQVMKQLGGLLAPALASIERAQAPISATILNSFLTLSSC